MNDSVKNGGSIEARTTKSLREATLNGVLIVSVSVLIIIGVILNILFYTRSMPVIDTLTGQKADASNLHDRIGVESKSIKGATSTQGYQDTIGKSASGYTGGGTGDDSGSGNNVNSLNVGSNSLPFSPNNADTGGVIPGNTIDDSSQPKVVAAGNNSSGSSSGSGSGSGSGSVGDSTSNTNVSSNNINTSSTLSSGVYCSSGVRVDR